MKKIQGYTLGGHINNLIDYENEGNIDFEHVLEDNHRSLL